MKEQLTKANGLKSQGRVVSQHTLVPGSRTVPSNETTSRKTRQEVRKAESQPQWESTDRQRYRQRANAPQHTTCWYNINKGSLQNLPSFEPLNKVFNYWSTHFSTGRWLKSLSHNLFSHILFYSFTIIYTREGGEWKGRPEILSQ